MRWRSDAEKIHCRKLAVFVVPELDEAFRSPSMRKEPAISVGHPWKIVPAVKKRGEIADLIIFAEALAASKGAREKPD